MGKTILQLRDKAHKHGFTYWWEYKDQKHVPDWMYKCNTFVFNNQGQHSHLLVLGFDGVLKIWIDMEDKR